jgi:hypothetical protein
VVLILHFDDDHLDSVDALRLRLRESAATKKSLSSSRQPVLVEAMVGRRNQTEATRSGQHSLIVVIAAPLLAAQR